MAAQLRRLDCFHTYEMFTNEPAERLTALLAALAPMPDARLFLTSGGSESVDSAIKLARVAHWRAGRPERQLVISRRNAYHGVTYGGTSVTGLPANQEGFGPLVGGVVQVDKDDLDEVAQVFAERGEEVAAVIAEPVMGAGGVYPPAAGYLAGLRRLCDAHGAFLILDEVICGFGRLGTWWGGQHYDVVPDLATFAKAVTSGYQPARRGAGRAGGAYSAGGRPGLHPAARSHLQRAPRVLRCGAGRTGHPRARGAAGPGAEDRRAAGLRAGVAAGRRPGRRGPRRRRDLGGRATR